MQTGCGSRNRDALSGKNRMRFTILRRAFSNWTRKKFGRRLLLVSGRLVENTGMSQ